MTTSYTSTAADTERRSVAQGRATRGPVTPGTGEEFDAGCTRYVTGASDREAAGDHQRSRALPGKRHRGKAGKVDSNLIGKAKEIVESVDDTDVVQMQLHLTALAGAILDMWESVLDASEVHQDLLAALENGARQAARAGQVTDAQLSAFREALNDLGQDVLVPANAEVVRSRFVDVGFAPLGFLGEPETPAPGTGE
jgi:hypothetical protein